MTPPDVSRLETIARRNPAIDRVWRGWHRIDLPDGWLVAGCLAQSVWNARFGMTPSHGIADLDIV